MNIPKNKYLKSLPAINKKQSYKIIYAHICTQICKN